jgi:hypothetical protein
VNTPPVHARRYRFLLLLHVATLFVALIVGLAVSWHDKWVTRTRHHSTYERQAPHLSNWPRHVHPLPRA